jgi:hypothetical protein
MHVLPESVMGGVLKFTYPGENFMGRRADLTGKTTRMVEIHASIRAPDWIQLRAVSRQKQKRSEQPARQSACRVA